MMWNDDRRSAVLLMACAVLLLALVAHHPIIARTASTSEFVAGYGAIERASKVFHAVVLLLAGGQALGLWTFAVRLGTSALKVRAGLLLFGTGLLLLVVAGTLDGHATPLLVQRCVGQPAACAAALAPALNLESAAIQALTTVGLGAQSLALVCWSLALPRGKPRQRIGSAVATAVALAPLAALALLAGPIGPARLVQLVLAASLWSLGAGLALWRGRLGEQAGAAR